jgi:hypothetical protein
MKRRAIAAEAFPIILIMLELKPSHSQHDCRSVHFKLTSCQLSLLEHT